MDTLSQEEQETVRRDIRRRIHKYVVLFLSIIFTAVQFMLDNLEEPPSVREPYHTSILTGEGWVMELLAGHPERIRCELGMRQHVFAELISELRQMGYTNSKYVSLEEQLAIFLYACITGLTIWHLGEWFQRSNDTISK